MVLSAILIGISLAIVAWGRWDSLGGKKGR
jgi:hypothetical protein